MATRSQRLWAGALVGRPVGVVYTVPAEFAVILKSIYVQLQVGTATTVAVAMIDPSSGANVTLVSWDIPAWGWRSWDGWAVLEAGDEVHLIYDQGPVHSWGSGALLPS